MKSSKHINDIVLKDGEVIDTFLDGKLHLIQSKSGYRFSIDAILLADFVRVKKNDVVVELGTGCGIVLLMLLKKSNIKRAVGIEIQEELASQALRNARLNSVQDRMYVITGDLRTCPLVPACADLVVCNPPYRKAKSGRLNPDAQRAVARHEIMVDLTHVIETAKRMLKTAGKFIAIYPAERITDILSMMRSSRIEPKFIRIIHSKPDSEAKLILVEGKRGGRPGLKIGQPLVIYNNDGSHTDEVDRMFMP